MAPLAVDASTRSPGLVMRMDPEAALTWRSPFTLATTISPEALFTLRIPPIPETSMPPLAADTCVSLLHVVNVKIA